MLKKKVLEELKSLNDKLDIIISEDRIRIILEGQIQQLQKEKAELWDRIMASNWETYKTYAPTFLDEIGEEVKLEETADAAGEILDVK
jgi:hypothetical protein